MYSTSNFNFRSLQQILVIYRKVTPPYHQGRNYLSINDNVIFFLLQHDALREKAVNILYEPICYLML